LIGYEDGDQNAGDGEPGLDDFPQHVALYGPFHGVELRAFAII
jgi:hypothetical protein